MSEQIPFILPYTTSYQAEAFVRGKANAAALDWLSGWPDWPAPYRMLNIFGPSGSGKTHLSHVFELTSNAVRLTKLRDIIQFEETRARHFIFDDVDHENAFCPEAMFHFFNYLASENGTALLLSTMPAGRMDIQMKDLKSRLRAIAAQEIYAPDDDLLKAVLQKMFEDRQIIVTDMIIDLMLRSMERNFTFAYHLVAQIDRRALASKKPVTLPLVRQVIENEMNKKSCENSNIGKDE